MELKKIHIQNFRSIKDETISFSHNCLVLLGKNEAGKTNILKAIASLFEQYKISSKDKRKRIDNEKIDSHFVRAIIELSSNDFKVIEEKFKGKYLGVDNIVFKSGIKFKQFIEKIFYNLLIQIEIDDNEAPEFTYWAYSKSDIDLIHPLFITGNQISKESGSNFDLPTRVKSIVVDLYKENNIKCHYWQYSEGYLLPNTVIIDDFITTPSRFPTLNNIFTLCGREDIKTEFETAISQDGDYANLFEQVSKKVTSTFQKIWKDFKGTSIELLPNGDEILIKVVDKAKYNFEDRSDGFKKFISILLMLSTQSRANKILESDLILIDEPDQSLYPTSAQYLRDELIEISKKSKIIYSTHSQYMIDSDVLDRHIVVEKSNDVTTLKKEDANAPYTSDELLRRAIGSSIFECLKPVNIIFEGYLDKELFRLYCKFQKIGKEFNKYGIVYLGGISGVETLTQILVLANKSFLIVADSDETSKNKKVDFEKNYPDFKNNWIGYADVCKSMTTMEDFLTIDFIKDVLQKEGYTHIYEPGKSAIYNIEKAVNKDKELKQQIKRKLVDSLKADLILTDYSNFINNLKGRLDDL